MVDGVFGHVSDIVLRVLGEKAGEDGSEKVERKE